MNCLSHSCKEVTGGRAGADKTQEHSFCVDINEGTNCVKERSGVDSVEIRLVTSSCPEPCVVLVGASFPGGVISPPRNLCLSLILINDYKFI